MGTRQEPLCARACSTTLQQAAQAHCAPHNSMQASLPAHAACTEAHSSYQTSPGRLHQHIVPSPANTWAGCISPASCALAARSCRAGEFCEAVVLAGRGSPYSAVQAAAQQQATTGSARLDLECTQSGQVATTLHRALMVPAVRREPSSWGKSSRMRASRQSQCCCQLWAVLPCPSF